MIILGQGKRDMTINDLGHTQALIIKTVYWFTGVSFVLYVWHNGAKKSFGDIFLLFFGPICWTALLIIRLFVKKKGRDYDADIRYRIQVDIAYICSMVPWAILGFWFCNK
jgi:hypothetical protein